MRGSLKYEGIFVFIMDYTHLRPSEDLVNYASACSLERTSRHPNPGALYCALTARYTVCERSDVVKSLGLLKFMWQGLDDVHAEGLRP